MRSACNTCGKDARHPWRVYDERGHVLLGCVDGAHDGQLVTPSASATWHNRSEAKEIRRNLRRFRNA